MDAHKRAANGFLDRFGIALAPEDLKLALTHRSYAYEHGGIAHNERLEFLGDAILGQAVTVKLFLDYPKLSEGELAKRRSSLVSAVALAEIARGIGLGEHLLLGRGEELTGGREKESILADTMEAIIGQVFLSAGPEQATAFVRELIEPLLEDPDRFTVSLDPKTSLQELASEHGFAQPAYEVIGSGPDHDRTFAATVHLGRATGTGAGKSKKAAEVAAARDAVAKFQASRKQTR
ncbi:ribonuclease III [Leucobacter sp. M11]|uniref:ribonuclease III n=1 Tax=Leucobacter sp. M11 TaxID=2993565 RepID=UPI002D7F5AEA|nr:ribonuclease III [Leucobacter sp. M11]MEB4613276.1 ribonuclease III [Leucobacter sp. M11]